jgi:hypothetical protein
MPRICLTILQFCLCAWVGVAMFFNVAVLGVLESLMYDRPPFSKFSEPGYFLPPYFGLAFALLGLAFLCAFGNLWNARIGLLRRTAILLLVAVTLAMIAVDQLVVYRGLAESFAPETTAVNASAVVRLFQLCRLLKRSVLGLSVVAGAMAIWPENDADLLPHPRDPAL